jgi:hypothetical protein
MSLIRLVESDCFWNVLIVLMLAWVVYLYATRPPMRPTNPVPAR